MIASETCKSLVILGLLILAAPVDQYSPTCGIAWGADKRTGDVISVRMKRTGVVETLTGALATLDDTQVRNRPGRNSAVVDSVEEGDGAAARVISKVPFFRKTLKLPVPDSLGMTNRTGEWASTVHFLPKKFGYRGEDAIAVLDSSLFMTAFVSYPLYFFRETGQAAETGRLRLMMDLTMKNISGYKRGGAYNFWAVLPGTSSGAPRTGPLNIPVKFTEGLARAYVNPRLAKFWKFFARNLSTPPKDWVVECLDEKANPTGADALFNIPNDSDDTSTAVAMQKLHSLFCDPSCQHRRVDREALEDIQNHRDIDRPREDGRDSWKGKDTGAFLTWLRSEREPVFGAPAQGVVPLGVNNVDCVVNSNVLFSLGLNRMTDLPGYGDCIELLARAVELKAWPRAGLYYPQNMIFPYCLTRAWRDGEIDSDRLSGVMGKLLGDLLEEAREHGIRTGRKGAFPGGEDRADHLSTALGLVSLLNIGRGVAEAGGLAERYDEAVEHAVDFLIAERRERKIEFSDTLGGALSGRGVRSRGYTWNSGLFFSASFWDLAHWRSQAFTVAVVTEALAKYVLAYDLGGVSVARGRKIEITSYAPSAPGELPVSLKVSQISGAAPEPLR